MNNSPDITTRFERAICRFDEENARDPNQVHIDGAEPRELVYSRWLSDWILRLNPGATEALRLAGRCQHICRWAIPRDSYPMNRAGYLRWRNELKKFHAEKSAAILRESGYDEATIHAVHDLNLKKNFPHDPDAQTLEDALCLVFLERQLAELASRTDDEKIINALRKSWNKMSQQAREFALQLSYDPKEKSLIERALRSDSGA